MAQRGVQWCEMHGDVVVTQMSEREHLSAIGRDLASKYVLAQQSGQLGVSLFQVLSEQVDRVDVLHAEHSKGSGSSSS